PFLQALKVTGRTVRGHDDLLLILMEMVKNMEKHLLRPILARQKLNIIDDQYINLHVKICKAFYVAVFDGIHKLVYKLFRRHIQDELILRAVLYLIADGLHKMRFA